MALGSHSGGMAVSPLIASALWLRWQAKQNYEEILEDAEQSLLRGSECPVDEAQLLRAANGDLVVTNGEELLRASDSTELLEIEDVVENDAAAAEAEAAVGEGITFTGTATTADEEVSVTAGMMTGL